LPGIWDKKSFLPGEQSWSKLLTGRELRTKTPEEKLGVLNLDPNTKEPIGTQTTLESGRPVLTEKKSDSYTKIIQNGDEAKSALKAKVGVTALKTLGTVADFGGVIDIVLGSIGMKKALKENDQGQIIANSMTITGGVSLTGAAVLGTASLAAPIGALASAMVAPFFWVGAVFAVGGFIAGTIATKVKRHNELQKTTDQQFNEFKSWADDGLAQGDWENKVKYLQNAYAIYNNDNPDASKSYFAAQAAEWDRFNKTSAQNGTDLNRLDDTLHVKSALTHTDSHSEIFTGDYQKFTVEKNQKIKELNETIEQAISIKDKLKFKRAIEERNDMVKDSLNANGETRDKDAFKDAYDEKYAELTGEAQYSTGLS
jgi:hypothetical protein